MVAAQCAFVNVAFAVRLSSCRGRRQGRVVLAHVRHCQHAATCVVAVLLRSLSITAVHKRGDVAVLLFIVDSLLTYGIGVLAYTRSIQHIHYV